MVLKNPYGYLIKNFKLIHFILLGIYIYLAVHVNSILQYYNQLIAGSASKLDAMSYVNNYYIYFIIISSIICVIVYALMKYKDKPRLLYVLLIGLYVVVWVMIRISYQGLNTIYLSVLETKTLRLYRDLLQIIVVAQYISIAFVLVRALGFDIKKFNFVKDLNELNLSEADLEEIEVTLGGTESIQWRFNRRLREFKYYYLENKAFIIIILVIVVCVALSGIVVDKQVVNKVYSEGEEFSTDDYRFNVLNSYITSLDWEGKSFANSDTTFVIVRLNIGVNRSAMKFNTSNLLLKVGNSSYTSNSRYASRFEDLGFAYRDSVIRNQGIYLFIYNILTKDINKKMILEYAGSKKIRLNPINLDEEKKRSEYKITENIDLSGSSFQGGHFGVVSYEIKDQFAYSYQYEVWGQTNTANLTISGNGGGILHLVIDSNLPSKFDNYSFLSSFGNLKYKIGDNVVVSSFKDKTPASYSDGLYLAVDGDVLKADSIWFEIAIRDQKYVYILK